MVATWGQRSKQTAEQEEVEPPQTDYERSRDRNVAENIKKMQEMGLHVLASDLNKSVPPSASKKGQNKGNKKTNSNNSDSSEYLLDDDDQGGSSDDDTELSDEEPIPLAIKKDSPPFKEEEIYQNGSRN
ncbi:hypothetical protein PVAP13_3NG170394 [Panicum virgatum]|uniref:Uncharacterized protein n=1 Tax=Panicum virgatum TaxID=38727 RepID=A0A8T0UHM9_PANVG|nr:hypothetical protein PVAP13_3NG170394 [Panicum virgatum]